MRVVRVPVAVALLIGLLACKEKPADKPAPAAAGKPAGPADAAPTLRIKDMTVPSVGAATVDEPPAEAVMITIKKTEILVEGDPIVQLTDGAAAPADKIAGQYGVEIEKLKIVLAKHAVRIAKLQSAQGLKGQLDIALVADAATSYDLFTSVLYSAWQADFSRYQLVVLRDAGKLGTIETGLSQPGEAEAPAGGLNLVVSITPTELTLYSTNDQSEGTAAAPKLKLAAISPATFELAKLTGAAEEIVKRRFPDGTRPAGSTGIVIVADRTVPYQTIIDVIIAVRATPDGVPLFPDVLFSAGPG